MPPHVSSPVYANFPSEKLTIAAGVCIFHLATERVILCYHSRDRYWFLPKGRKNANESVERAAEREGFEESGYRNRLLPVPMKHRQPDSDRGHPDFVTEPLWTQFLPLTASSQYLLFWYVAETLPKDIEPQHDADAPNSFYRPPPEFPEGMTLKDRIAADSAVDENGQAAVHQPQKVLGTAQDDEEEMYESYLLTVSDARQKLKGSVMEDVVRRGWDAVRLRMQMEEKIDAKKSLNESGSQ